MSLSIEEIEAIETILPLLPKDAVIFDVGANHGVWTDMMLKKLPEAQFHLFEPNGHLQTNLYVKYSEERKQQQIQLQIYAVYKEDGVDLPFFYFTNENDGLSSIYHNPEWDHLPMKRGLVKSITLDSYCGTEINHIDCLKIDVEGAEFDVLLGCKGLLERKAIKYIQIEYSPHYKLTDRTFMDIVKYVREFGYSAYMWHHGDFVKITEDNFVENFRLENFIVTFEALENVTQHWNKEFINNTKDLPKAELALECGVFEGLTSKYICEHLLLPGGRLICIDPLKDEYLTEQLSEQDIRMNREYGFFKKQYFRFKKNTAGLPIELIRKTTNEAFPELKDYRFGLIYIDGDHRLQQVYEDGVNAFNVCKINGIIIFDDFSGWSDETTKGIENFIDWAGNRINIIEKSYQLVIRKIKE